MKISELVKELDLTVFTKPDNLEREISGGYASDLLSNVMAQTIQDQVWVTIQAHQNIVAVASLINLSGIILAGDTLPDEKTIDKANEEDIIILGTKLSAFELIGQMYKLGISGE